MAKAYDISEVLASAVTNFAYLESAVYSYAQSVFSEETYRYISRRPISGALKVTSSIVRESDNIQNDPILGLIGEVEALLEHRNNILHNPSMVTLHITPGEETRQDVRIISRKNMSPIEGYTLAEINDYATTANRLSGEIRGAWVNEIAERARS